MAGTASMRTWPSSKRRSGVRLGRLAFGDTGTIFTRLGWKTSIFFGSAAPSTPNASYGPPRQVDEARAEVVEGVERGINPIVTLENQPLNMIANLV